MQWTLCRLARGALANTGISRCVVQPPSSSPQLTLPAVSLQAIFTAGSPIVTPDALEGALRAYAPSLQRAIVETEEYNDQVHIGTAQWFSKSVSPTNKNNHNNGTDELGGHLYHAIQFMIRRDETFPPSVLETTLDRGLYDGKLKYVARQGTSSALLFHRSAEVEEREKVPHPTSALISTLDKYVALAAVCGALSSVGAACILNINGQMSAPASLLLRAASLEGGADPMAALATLPLPSLFCGFEKYEVEGTAGVWMRTHGAEMFRIPNMAYHAQSHAESEAVFFLLSAVLQHMVGSGTCFTQSDVLDMGGARYALRRPSSEEYFLEETHELLVLDKESA